MTKREILICDANVLIDFCSVDKSILGLLNTHLFEIQIPDIILAEVNNLSEGECAKLGIAIMETPLDLREQVENLISGCSAEDAVCYMLAKNKGCLLATNDRKLRKECKKAGITLYWGLELILPLVKSECLSKKKAENSARTIANLNKMITESVVQGFLDKLKNV